MYCGTLRRSSVTIDGHCAEIRICNSLNTKQVSTFRETRLSANRSALTNISFKYSYRHSFPNSVDLTISGTFNKTRSCAVLYADIQNVLNLSRWNRLLVTENFNNYSVQKKKVHFCQMQMFTTLNVSS